MSGRFPHYKLIRVWAVQGLNQEYCDAINEAREEVTKNRKQIGKLCGGTKDKGKKGGLVGSKFIKLIRDTDAEDKDGIKTGI